MIKRSYPSLTLIGLIVALAFSVFTRGAHLRIFWMPVSILVGFLFAGLLISINHGRPNIRLNPKTDLPLIGFLGWGALSFVTSINQETTYFEVMRLSSLVMVYFLAAYAFDEEEHKKILVYALLGIGLLEAVYGIFGFMSGYHPLDLARAGLPRTSRFLTGTFGNHNHFAGLMEMCIFIGFGLIATVAGKSALQSEQTAKRILLAIPCGAMILALTLCLSRGGWISFAVTVPLFMSLYWWNEHRLWSRALVLVLMIMLIFVGVFIMKMDLEPLVERVQTLESPDEITTNIRTPIWKSSVAMIRDHPLTGTGWGTFRSAYPLYRADFVFSGTVFAHNDYLQIAAGMGLPGLVFFLLFIAMIFWEGARVIRSRGHDFEALIMPGLLACLFAVLVHELVDFNLMIPANAMIFFVVAGLVSRRGREVS